MKTFKRDYMIRMDRADTPMMQRQRNAALTHHNEVHAHHALGML